MRSAKIGVMDEWNAVYRKAMTQYGVISREQALAAGVAASTWQRRLASEAWRRPFPRVAAVPGAPPTFEREVMAALLSIGPPVVASHATAAYLHGLIERRPSSIEVLMPLTRRQPALTGVVAHRTGRVGEHEPVAKPRGILATSVERTLCDIAGSYSKEADLRPLVIAAVQRRLTTLDRLEASHLALGRYAGSALVRRILEQLDLERCDSELEYLVRQRLRAAGLHPAPGPVPITLLTGRTVYIDVGFPPLRVGCEVDSEAHHSEQKAIAKDHAKQNELQAVGLALLRVTWYRIDREWGAFVNELRRNLREAEARDPWPGYEEEPPRLGG